MHRIFEIRGESMCRLILLVLSLCCLSGCGIIRQRQVQVELQAITDRCRSDIRSTKCDTGITRPVCLTSGESACGYELFSHRDVHELRESLIVALPNENLGERS